MSLSYTIHHTPHIIHHTSYIIHHTLTFVLDGSLVEVVDELLVGPGPLEELAEARHRQLVVGCWLLVVGCWCWCWCWCWCLDRSGNPLTLAPLLPSRSAQDEKALVVVVNALVVVRRVGCCFCKGERDSRQAL
jgi:hypothetical protein